MPALARPCPPMGTLVAASMPVHTSETMSSTFGVKHRPIFVPPHTLCRALSPWQVMPVHAICAGPFMAAMMLAHGPCRGPLAAARHVCPRPLSGPLTAGIQGLRATSASALGCNASGFAVVAPSATPVSLRPGQRLPQRGKMQHLRLAVRP